MQPIETGKLIGKFVLIHTATASPNNLIEKNNIYLNKIEEKYKINFCLLYSDFLSLRGKNDFRIKLPRRSNVLKVKKIEEKNKSLGGSSLEFYFKQISINNYSLVGVSSVNVFCRLLSGK